MLALTMGEPAGIAPEITAAAWHALAATGPAFVLVGDAGLVRDRALALGRDIAVTEVATIAEAAAIFATPCRFSPAPCASRRRNPATPIPVRQQR